ncbi:hypothetical protein NUW58_g4566 [Xylaria curta]|uniref:Uncharacterized protein n=1 Tax=Xylaria curta TaxID=42375 RepID=A0ACC1P744_9PEZI|nr:hypothetical protein NUW58_g4566 [Xylaria curta]
MSRYLELNQAINDLAYSELRPPSRGASPDALDEEAIMEENAREFYRFELALPAISGTRDRLLQYANTCNSKELESKDHKDQIWNTVREGLKNEVIHTGHKIQSDGGIDNGPEAKFGQFVDSFSMTGLPDPNLRLSLFPASVNGWVAEVTRKTGLNQLMEWGVRKLFSPSPPEPPSSRHENERIECSIQAAEALYDFLAPQQCPANQHIALLQLSGFHNSSHGNAVFDMFLSCSGLEPHYPLEKCFNICHKMQTARARQIPLRLSFSLRRLWVSSSNPRLLPAHEKSVKCVRLENLLQEGVLKTSELGDSLKKFRLAVRLASSLHKLYSGSWIQQEWNAKSVHIVQNGNVRPIEMLDEAYILCVFSKERPQLDKHASRWEQHDSTEACPRFFLELAQLLVDIVNGERHHPPFIDEPARWYDALANDVRRNIEDRLMGKYWMAIENCLLYSAHDESESRRNPDGKRRAQEIIKEHIVRYLQDNLDLWEQQHPNQILDSHIKNERQYSYGQIQTSKNTNTGQIAPRQSPGDLPGIGEANQQTRRVVEPEFCLWSDKDDDWEILNEPIAETSTNSFNSYMKKFLGSFIEPLPQPIGDSKVNRRVRIAIIDTGFYQDMSDTYFLPPKVMKRIIGRQNFFSPDDTAPDPENWEDNHGHGTQIARLLLRYAPRAEILIAKISDSKSLKNSKKESLLQAFRWAVHGGADIINLSFGLGSKPDRMLAQEIETMVVKKKLIFAASSNTGQFGGRAWPATAPGVFAIHATNEHGTVDTDMNPEPLPSKDNFATLGCKIESYWNGHFRSISGTSFAAPIAAAIAANIIEFIRRQLPDVAEEFTSYRIMRGLFRDHMTMNSTGGIYHKFKPWAKGLWDEENEMEDVCKELRRIHRIYTYGY